MAVSVFYDALRTSERIEGERKWAWHIRSSEVEAMLRMRRVPESERHLLWRKLGVLEKAWNETRRSKKKPPKPLKRGR